MPATTPNRGFHYPVDDDPVQPPEDIQALAMDLDSWNPGRHDIDPSLNLVAGICVPYMGTTAPPGWLMADGSVIANAASVYPDLWANSNPAWRAGTSLNLPDLRGRSIFGTDNMGTAKGAAGRWVSGNSLAATGGSQFYTIPIESIPIHNHGMTHYHVQNHDHPNDPNAQLEHTHFDSPPVNLPIPVCIQQDASTLYIVDATLSGGGSGSNSHRQGVTLSLFHGNKPDVDLAPYPQSGNPGLTSVPKDATANTINATGNTGSGTPMTFMPPFIILNFLIKT